MGLSTLSFMADKWKDADFKRTPVATLKDAVLMDVPGIEYFAVYPNPSRQTVNIDFLVRCHKNPILAYIPFLALMYTPERPEVPLSVCTYP